MSKMIKSMIEVVIKNIDVSEEYYSFDWLIKIDGNEEDSGSYESDYENGNTIAQQLKMLENGEAVKIALTQYC